MAANGQLNFASPQQRADLATYLGRAARIEDGALRIHAVTDRVVALWVPVLRPAGILDDSPLVIAVRAIPATITNTDPADCYHGQFDAVVPLRGMLDRLARTPDTDSDSLHIPLPPDRLNESWTGQRPPLAGWQTVAELDANALTQIAEAGIAEIGEQFSSVLGQIRAERARTHTWTASLDEHTVSNTFDQAAEVSLPPAGAAFAAHALGFLPLLSNAPVRCSIAPGWWRLAFPAGQVLVRRR